MGSFGVLRSPMTNSGNTDSSRDYFKVPHEYAFIISWTLTILRFASNGLQRPTGACSAKKLQMWWKGRQFSYFEDPHPPITAYGFYSCSSLTCRSCCFFFLSKKLKKKSTTWYIYFLNPGETLHKSLMLDFRKTRKVKLWIAPSCTNTKRCLIVCETRVQLGASEAQAHRASISASSPANPLRPCHFNVLFFHLTRHLANVWMWAFLLIWLQPIVSEKTLRSKNNHEGMPALMSSRLLFSLITPAAPFISALCTWDIYIHSI